jgi:hypothetical protein
MLTASLELLEQLELERESTMLDPNFQEWKKSLNVSRLYSNPEPLINAAQMNKEYSFNRENKVGRLANIFYL